MNPTVLIAAVCALGLSAPVLAQTPPPAARAVPVAPHYGQGEPLGNYETGVNIDRYVGDPARAPTRIAHGALYTRRIFGPGDASTGSAGAVLPAGQQTELATLRPYDSTPLVASAKQTLFYVDSGQGRLDDGVRAWDLRPGVAVVAPAAVAFRLINTGGAPLTMVRFTFDPRPGSAPLTGLQVRDSHKLGMTAQGVLWNANVKLLFGPEAGVERVMLVSFGPMTLTGLSALAPRADPADGSEQWVRVASEDSPGAAGDLVLQLGSEVREWPVHGGYVAPADGKTVHGQYNVGAAIEDTLVIIGPRRSARAAGEQPDAWRSSPLESEDATALSRRESLVPGRRLNER